MIRYTLDHVHLQSRDPAATALYYRDVFGGVIHESTQLDGRRRFDVELGNVNLYILPASGAAADPSRVPAGSGIHHFALRVDDLAEASAELKRRGARFVDEPRVSRLRAGLQVAFIETPEGVLIELLSRAPMSG